MEHTRDTISNPFIDGKQMAHTLKSVDDLKPAPYNPRQIGDDALAGLEYSLIEFGDISGLTWNARTGNLVSGHQRLKAIKARALSKLTIKGGAIHGRFAPDKGGKDVDLSFPVRVVDWDEMKEKAANIAANAPTIAGTFTPELAPILAELDAKLPALSSALHLADLVMPVDATIPEGNTAIDEDGMANTENECPKCGFQW